jgi:hypothetical protein
MKLRGLIAIAVLLLACKESSKSTDKGKDSAKGPADVDVEALIDDVKCKKSDDRKGCECLRAFDKAKAFDDMPDDGQDNWVGYTYALGGSGNGKKQYFFGQFKSGKGNVRVLFPENDDEEADAKKLVKAVSGGDKAPKDSEAAKFIKTAKPEGGFHTAGKTKGVSLKLDVDEGIAYLRRDGDRLLVVESGDGEIQMSFKDQKLSAKVFCSELWKM